MIADLHRVLKMTPHLSKSRTTERSLNKVKMALSTFLIYHFAPAVPVVSGVSFPLGEEIATNSPGEKKQLTLLEKVGHHHRVLRTPLQGSTSIHHNYVVGLQHHVPRPRVVHQGSSCINNPSDLPRAEDGEKDLSSSTGTPGRNTARPGEVARGSSRGDDEPAKPACADHGEWNVEDDDDEPASAKPACADPGEWKVEDDSAKPACADHGEWNDEDDDEPASAKPACADPGEWDDEDDDEPASAKPACADHGEWKVEDDSAKPACADPGERSDEDDSAKSVCPGESCFSEEDLSAAAASRVGEIHQNPEEEDACTFISKKMKSCGTSASLLSYLCTKAAGCFRRTTRMKVDGTTEQERFDEHEDGLPSRKLSSLSTDDEHEDGLSSRSTGAKKKVSFLGAAGVEEEQGEQAASWSTCRLDALRLLLDTRVEPKLRDAPFAHRPFEELGREIMHFWKAFLAAARSVSLSACSPPAPGAQQEEDEQDLHGVEGDRKQLRLFLKKEREGVEGIMDTLSDVEEVSQRAKDEILTAETNAIRKRIQALEQVGGSSCRTTTSSGEQLPDDDLRERNFKAIERDISNLRKHISRIWRTTWLSEAVRDSWKRLLNIMNDSTSSITTPSSCSLGDGVQQVEQLKVIIKLTQNRLILATQELEQQKVGNMVTLLKDYVDDQRQREQLELYQRWRTTMQDTPFLGEEEVESVQRKLETLLEEEITTTSSAAGSASLAEDALALQDPEEDIITTTSSCTTGGTAASFLAEDPLAQQMEKNDIVSRVNKMMIASESSRHYKQMVAFRELLMDETMEKDEDGNEILVKTDLKEGLLQKLDLVDVGHILGHLRLVRKQLRSEIREWLAHMQRAEKVFFFVPKPDQRTQNFLAPDHRMTVIQSL